MNMQSNAMPESPEFSSTPELAPASTVVFPPTRLLYWSVRRELWENRSIIMGPLFIAALALGGFLISTSHLPDVVRELATQDAASQRGLIAMPYSLVASVIIVTGMVVGWYYCLDALSSERRDRSILFWKSMPVSDFTTVLSKAGIPLVVLPLFTFALALATQLVMLVASAAILLANGVGVAMLWSSVPLFQMSLVMLYGLIVHALWFAPLYGYLLLVSAWARRATFLWSVLPFVAIFIVERLAFGTSRFGSMLQYRFTGAMAEAFAAGADGEPFIGLSQLDPLRFLGSPGLWLGLAFAGACIAGAVRLRRDRAPG